MLMKGNIRLRIPTPCHEDWEAMRPGEKGRFCGSCAKTVVDFSMMTDQEVIGYLARAGRNVCGRMAPEQLGRDFVLASGGMPSPGRRRNLWYWLVAGLLVSAEVKGQGASVKGRVEQVKVQVLDTVTVVGYGVKGKMDISGMVESMRCKDVQKTSAEQGLYGYLGAISFGIVVDTFRDRVVDTLAAVGLWPKPTLSVYPNPARRGGAVSLNWRQTEAGEYSVTLINASGGIVQQRILRVGGKDQVDLIDLPPALPAGMYFLRATRPGGAKVITLKIMLI